MKIRDLLVRFATLKLEDEIEIITIYKDRYTDEIVKTESMAITVDEALEMYNLSELSISYFEFDYKLKIKVVLYK